jgi:hypothetical protein
MKAMLATLLAAAVALGSLGACTETYEYEPATAGDEEGSGREPRAKTSSQFLRTVYADLLGRTPESYELSLSFGGGPVAKLPIDEERDLVTVLEGIGDSLPMRNLLVNGLLHSAEVSIPDKATASNAGDPRPYITTQFERLLGRSPNAYELEAFAAEWLKEPAVGPRTIIRAIIGSREYQSQ